MSRFFNRPATALAAALIGLPILAFAQTPTPSQSDSEQMATAKIYWDHVEKCWDVRAVYRRAMENGVNPTMDELWDAIIVSPVRKKCGSNNTMYNGRDIDEVIGKTYINVCPQTRVAADLIKKANPGIKNTQFYGAIKASNLHYRCLLGQPDSTTAPEDQNKNASNSTQPAPSASPPAAQPPTDTTTGTRSCWDAMNMFANQMRERNPGIDQVILEMGVERLLVNIGCRAPDPLPSNVVAPDPLPSNVIAPVGANCSLPPLPPLPPLGCKAMEPSCVAVGNNGRGGQIYQWQFTCVPL
jgi:hypothetical protein